MYNSIIEIMAFQFLLYTCIIQKTCKNGIVKIGFLKACKKHLNFCTET